MYMYLYTLCVGNKTQPMQIMRSYPRDISSTSNASQDSHIKLCIAAPACLNQSILNLDFAAGDPV